MKKPHSDPPWTPLIPAEDLPELGEDGIWINSRYQVNARRLGARPPFGEVVHLSVKRRDKQPIRNWRDLQRIKNELCGKEAEAVEIFPRESNLVDSANQYHLYAWLDYHLPFGFEGRFVSERSAGGSVQEPFEEGAKPADCGARDAEADQFKTRFDTRVGLRKASEIASKKGKL